MPLPAVLPDSIGQLSSLKQLYLGANALTGTYFCIPRTTSYPADTIACSVARLDRPTFCSEGARRGPQRPDWYVLVVPILRPTLLTPLPAALPETFGQLTAMTTCNLSDNKLAGTYLFITSTTPHVFLQHRR